MKFCIQCLSHFFLLTDMCRSVGAVPHRQEHISQLRKYTIITCIWVQDLSTSVHDSIIIYNNLTIYSASFPYKNNFKYPRYFLFIYLFNHEIAKPAPKPQLGLCLSRHGRSVCMYTGIGDVSIFPEDRRL